MGKKEYMRKFKKTKNGVISTLYGTQKTNSKKRGHRPPDYNSKEFKQWLYSLPEFHVMYNEWVMSEYDTLLKPSVNRLLDSVHYCFGNIELVTWGEHRKITGRDAKSGRNPKTLSPVTQMDLDGNVIAEHHSMNEAERVTGIPTSNIHACLTNKSRRTKGFTWKRK